MHGKFIGDDGAIYKFIRFDYSAARSDAVSVMLDQANTYDRMYPEYLGQIVLRFGFGE